jgi:hypothetical protein
MFSMLSFMLFILSISTVRTAFRGIFLFTNVSLCKKHAGTFSGAFSSFIVMTGSSPPPFFFFWTVSMISYFSTE